MKLFSIIIFRSQPESVVLHVTQDLSSFGFFKRGTVRELFMFASREVINRSKQRTSIDYPLKDMGTYKIHSYVNERDCGCVIITDGEYPARASYIAINKAIEAFELQYKATNYDKDCQLSVPDIEKNIVTYQKPEEIDKISKIQGDLDETKEILLKSIDQLLERGEKIEDLLDRSKDLSDQSKTLMIRARKLNSCCIII